MNIQNLTMVIILVALMNVAFGSGGNYRTDSRSPYVHIITPYDKNGERIDYQDKFEAQPYSPAMTCGKCHDIDAIGGGWHFNAHHGDVPSGRQGEPWIWTDPDTRTQLPLSYRKWPGTWHPEEVGLDRWEFTRHFGRHLTGGGISLAEKSEGENEGPDSPGRSSRWPISGDLEIDCMTCHSADRSYSPEEWAKQISQENYHWAPTAALGLANIKGNTRDIPDSYDPEFPELTIEEVDIPVTEYDPKEFDLQGRVFFDVVRQPPNERCYYCHTAHGVDKDLPPRHQRDIDVHMAAGMNCTDCHRHGLDHQVARGYEGEQQHSSNPAAGTLTCANCHIGQDSLDDPLLHGGRLGAPLAKHKDIPQIHFEKLECTACHSGPWPQKQTLHVQTALAHALGLSDEHRAALDPPHIVEPVFLRQPEGKIGVHRMMWPSFWGVMENENMNPLHLDVVSETLGDTFAVDENEIEEYPRGWKPLTTQQVSDALSKLQQTMTDGQQAVYVSDGKVHQLDKESIVDSQHAVAQPYSWPLAHDVRGGGQSLGARQCTDCHASDAPFFFGEVALDTEAGIMVTSMKSLQGDYGPEFKKTNLMFKWLIYLTVGALLFHILADVIGGTLRRKSQNGS
jgi:hypothetical protein